MYYLIILKNIYYLIIIFLFKKNVCPNNLMVVCFKPCHIHISHPNTLELWKLYNSYLKFMC